MPTALVEVRRRYSEAEEVALMDAVHGALVAAFRIPPEDKNVRLIAHEPHRFACSPNRAQPEFFTLVTIDCFAGRSVQAKRNLYAEIVDRLAPFGIPQDHVLITLRESGAENWGIRGGQAASDVDLGFDVHV
ncbi:tautomerase family protein [Kribbella sp. NBC_00889]|uniref:tautomerase family protein n=1 Tax=Kribbella sp. NBC_00889 TaxID=2975974 RepID=UPI003869521C|nr:tautomerase family protein [Kribbella sp. NBC_00889]